MSKKKHDKDAVKIVIHNESPTGESWVPVIEVKEARAEIKTKVDVLWLDTEHFEYVGKLGDKKDPPPGFGWRAFDPEIGELLPLKFEIPDWEDLEAGDLITVLVAEPAGGEPLVRVIRKEGNRFRELPERAGSTRPWTVPVKIEITGEQPTSASWIPVIRITEAGLGDRDILLRVHWLDNRECHYVGLVGAPVPTGPGLVQLRIPVPVNEDVRLPFTLPNWEHMAQGDFFTIFQVSVDGTTSELRVIKKA